VKTLSDKEWGRYIEECADPLAEQDAIVNDEVDKIIYRKSNDPKEFAKYQKMKKIATRVNLEQMDIAGNARLDKKQLERFVTLMLVQVANDELKLKQNQVAFYEFGEAIGMVERRFGFKNEWLVYLSLIQLHENLIKKKITELGGSVGGDDKIPVLIPRLAGLIKEKEDRDVSLALLMSNGIKHARDTMTHDGYRRAVSKGDLCRLYEEIAEFEDVLYPRT
jgi:hypothetical protein